MVILYVLHISILGVRRYLCLDLMEKTDHNPENLDFEQHVVTGIGLQLVSLGGGGKYVPRMARWIYMDTKGERLRQRLPVVCCQNPFFPSPGHMTKLCFPEPPQVRRDHIPKFPPKECEQE